MNTNTIDRAIARFSEPMDTSAEKVVGAGVHIVAIMASPNWALPTAADLQAATQYWGTETSNITAGEKLIASLEKQLEVARSDQLATLRRWGMRRQGVLVAINVFCDGSKDTMKTFGVEVSAAATHVDAEVPVDVKPVKTRKTGLAGVTWYGTPVNRSGFQVQHATNIADPTTYSAPIPCSKRSFYLSGQIPAATIYFRVLAQDPALPGGQTAWTAWVAAVASL